MTELGRHCVIAKNNFDSLSHETLGISGYRVPVDPLIEPGAAKGRFLDRVDPGTVENKQDNRSLCLKPLCHQSVGQRVNGATDESCLHEQATAVDADRNIAQFRVAPEVVDFVAIHGTRNELSGCWIVYIVRHAGDQTCHPVIRLRICAAHNLVIERLKTRTKNDGNGYDLSEVLVKRVVAKACLGRQQELVDRDFAHTELARSRLADGFYDMRVGKVANVMEQRCVSYVRLESLVWIFPFVLFTQIGAVTFLVANPAKILRSDVIDPERVFEPRMGSRWVHKICESELPDAAEALQERAIQQDHRG
jgi:hypothetical protein